MTIKLHPSIQRAMSRERIGVELRRAYDHVLTERIPDDLRQLVERLK